MIEVRGLWIATGAGEALAWLRSGIRGRVLSSFQRVTNLEAGDRLLAIHASGVPATPFSLVLSSAVGQWQPATPVSYRDERLVLGEVEIVLAGVEDAPASGALHADRAAFGPASAWLAEWAAQSAFGVWWSESPVPTEPMQAALRRIGSPALQSLAASGPTVEAFHAASQRLLGLGPGGTPSGDDVLVGYLAAWLRLSGDEAGALQAAADLAARAPAATTRLAAEFIYHLSKGRLAAQLERLLSAIAAGEEIAVIEAATALAAYGATSGKDTIAGVHAWLCATSSDEAAVEFGQVHPRR